MSYLPPVYPPMFDESFSRPPSNTQPQAADGCIHYDTSNGDLAAADVVTNVHQDDAEMNSVNQLDLTICALQASETSSDSTNRDTGSPIHIPSSPTKGDLTSYMNVAPPILVLSGPNELGCAPSEVPPCLEVDLTSLSEPRGPVLAGSVPEALALSTTDPVQEAVEPSTLSNSALTSLLCAIGVDQLLPDLFQRTTEDTLRATDKALLPIGHGHKEYSEKHTEDINNNACSPLPAPVIPILDATIADSISTDDNTELLDESATITKLAQTDFEANFSLGQSQPVPYIVEDNLPLDTELDASSVDCTPASDAPLEFEGYKTYELHDLFPELPAEALPISSIGTENSQNKYPIELGVDLPPAANEPVLPDAIAFQEDENMEPVSPSPSYSSLPSSSPPGLFSSSPPPDDLATPPSSSPPPVRSSQADEKRDAVGYEIDDSSMPLQHSDYLTNTLEEDSSMASRMKPELDEEPSDNNVSDNNTSIADSGPQEISIATDMQMNAASHQPPNPKRPTFASQEKQYRKLARPFRSPVINNDSPLMMGKGVYVGGKVEKPSVLVNDESPVPTATVITEPFKDHTKNAAKQFKSPLSQTVTGPSPSLVTTNASGRYSDAQSLFSIQQLQAKVQKLKQAIKIKQDGNGEEEEQLAKLVSKWRTAGRDVAWEVWDTVKDLAPGEGPMIGPLRGGWDEGEKPFGQTQGGKRRRDGWGYDDDRGGKKAKVEGFESSWGWNNDQKNAEIGAVPDEDSAMEVEDEEVDTPQHALGTMLRFMGIAPETLGWNEDEGDFVGDA
ncbi:unnamed protein product [Somion occarium]|uniref:Uncharacterized protein n=1 Tax=Somion occarium TaxID=3059160 RepID=A0ABP1D1A6_9APHY